MGLARIIVVLFLASGARAAAEGAAPPLRPSRALPYSGRLLDEQANAVPGPVDLQLDLYGSEEGDDRLVPAALVLPRVALENGVFRVQVVLAVDEVTALFGVPPRPVFLQIKDLSHNRVYRRQPFEAPAALPAPVAEAAAGPVGPALPGGPVPLAAGVTAAAASGAEGAPVLSTTADASPSVPVAGGVGAAPVAAAGVVEAAPVPVAAGVGVGAAPLAAVGVATSSPREPLLSAAGAACLGSPVAGGKFVALSRDLAVPCGAVCAATRTAATCLRGWTLFGSGDQSFDFGNECTSTDVPGGPAVDARLCCCLTTSGPMPLLVPGATPAPGASEPVTAPPAAPAAHP